MELKITDALVHQMYVYKPDCAMISANGLWS